MSSTARLSRIALGATLFLVGVGGFTRGSGSGYGCADRWPLCENGLLGGLLPRAEYHMVIEWTHRWVAAIVGLLVLATAVSVWRHHRSRKALVRTATAVVVVVGIQAWIGRMVVKADLDADLVVLHLAISMVVVGLLTLVAVATSPSRVRTDENRAWTNLLVIAAAGSYVLLLLGAYVHNMFFSGWPLVGNQLVPDLSNSYTAVHFTHRLVAGLGLVYLVYLTRAAGQNRRPAIERRLLHAATGFYAVNVALGAVHVFTEVSWSGVVATHLLLAGIVWTLLLAAAALSRPSPAEVD
ncbi:MAG: COX15/CtaA family protein [Acidimicrobiia bacterium]|nr:COX15/CtaA family protein [Actinomycetota bacterium]MBL6925671.1 COX15/CtaA family protein [Acidimicrobiia bacterium]